MKKETTIKMIRYFTEDEIPTCAFNFQTGEVCKFYCTRKTGMTGTLEYCALNISNILERGKNGAEIGYLIPGKYCIFKDEK